MGAKTPRPVARPGGAGERCEPMPSSQPVRRKQFASLSLAGGRPRRKAREPPPLKRRQNAAEPAAPTQSDIAPTASIQPPNLVDGRALARRMQPALLRHQFILTEVLRPPLALREDDSD